MLLKTVSKGADRRRVHRTTPAASVHSTTGWPTKADGLGVNFNRTVPDFSGSMLLDHGALLSAKASGPAHNELVSEESWVERGAMGLASHAQRGFSPWLTLELPSASSKASSLKGPAGK